MGNTNLQPRGELWVEIGSYRASVCRWEFGPHRLLMISPERLLRAEHRVQDQGTPMLGIWTEDEEGAPEK